VELGSEGVPALKIKFVTVPQSDQRTINGESSPRVLEAIEFEPSRDDDGRQRISGAAMSGAERTRRYRARLRAGPVDVISLQADLLLLDEETIAARIIAGCSPEKADAIARSINQRLVVWRYGSLTLCSVGVSLCALCIRWLRGGGEQRS